MEQRRRQLVLFVAVIIAAVTGCRMDKATQVVVSIGTDLKVPDDFDCLVVQATYQGAEKTNLPYDLKAPGSPDLTKRQTLTLKAGSDTTSPVNITVSGKKGGCDGATVVLRRAVVRWVPQKILLLRIDLTKSCLGVLCVGADDQTCIDGSCLKVQQEPLPDYTPEAAFAVGCPDGRRCSVYYCDRDQDGLGIAVDSRCLCAPAAPYTATAAGDCDDQDPAVTSCTASIIDSLRPDTAINWNVVSSYQPLVFQRGVHARWKISIAKGKDVWLPYLEVPPGLTFYAVLNGESGTLAIYAEGDPAAALRVFLPPSRQYFTSEGADFSWVWNPSLTVLYRALLDTTTKAVADGVFSAGAGTRGIFSYGASAYRTVNVIGAYFAANEFDGGLSGFHHWPPGASKGRDQCKYAVECFTCEYSKGAVEKEYSFTYGGASNKSFLLAGCAQDGGDTTAIHVDDNQWLTNDPVSVGAEVARGEAFSGYLPAKLKLLGNKQSARVRPWLYYAVADDRPHVKASAESPDVDDVIEMGVLYRRPRLSVGATGITLSPQQPSAGEVVTISVDVKNTGDEEARDVRVFFHVDGLPNTAGGLESVMIGSTPVTVPAHSSAPASLAWKAIKGEHYLRVVDRYNSGPATKCSEGAPLTRLTIP